MSLRSPGNDRADGGSYSRMVIKMILLLAGLLAHLWCFPAHAQVSGGALSGVVTNTSQVAMPGAQVTLKNAATGVARVVTTGAGGLYTSPNLDPGTYLSRCWSETNPRGSRTP